MPAELLKFALVLARKVVVHHKLHFLNLDDVVLHFLTLSVFVPDLEAHFS